jgi:hypothetical protein
MAAGVTFTPASGKRIAKSVKKTEAMRDPAPKGNRPTCSCQRARIGYLDGASAIDSMATVKLYLGDPGSETDSNETFQAWNGFGALDDNARVMCHHNGRGWHIGTGTCPA